MIKPQYGEHQRPGPGASTVIIQIVISALIQTMLMLESSHAQLALVVAEN
jgi:hypothetical protein